MKKALSKSVDRKKVAIASTTFRVFAFLFFALIACFEVAVVSLCYHEYLTYGGGAKWVICGAVASFFLLTLFILRAVNLTVRSWDRALKRSDFKSWKAAQDKLRPVVEHQCKLRGVPVPYIAVVEEVPVKRGGQVRSVSIPCGITHGLPSRQIAGRFHQVVQVA